MPDTVGVRELRDGLTRHLRRVRRGASVVISDRGEPVALLVPYRGRGRPKRFERLAAVLAGGLVHAAERPFAKRLPAVRGRGRLPSRLIAEGRR